MKRALSPTATMGTSSHRFDHPKTEKVQICSRLRLNPSKLVFAVNMTPAVGTA